MFTARLVWYKASCSRCELEADEIGGPVAVMVSACKPVYVVKLVPRKRDINGVFATAATDAQ
jgi:hypothetical protein